MDDIFKHARARRRRLEFALTSRNTNDFHYGAPAYATKKHIWPPLSSDLKQDAPWDLEAALPKQQALDDNDSNSSHSSDIPEARPLHPFSGPDQLYAPLHEGQTIRLLEIKAGENDDQLSGNLHCVDLQAPGLYFEAVSYVWGMKKSPRSFREDETPKRTIHLNSHELSISANLGEVLRALRFKDAVRTVWVDAICINQGDARERGHQVTLMSSIYSSSQQVTVWLGECLEKFARRSRGLEESDDVYGERAFAAICEVVNHWLSERSTTRQASYRIMSSSQQEGHIRTHSSVLNTADMKGSKRLVLEKCLDRELKGQIGPDVNDSLLWEPISMLFDRSWFWRLWVFQEIVLARTAVVRLGHAEIDWQWLGLAAAIIRTNYHHLVEDSKLGGVYNAYLMFRSSTQSDLPPVKFDFLRLLRLTRQFEVTDARDRIYGLLGIATDDNQPGECRLIVRPDYTVSTGELWKRLAVTLLTNTEDLSLLSCVQFQADKLESERRLYRHDSMRGWRPEQDSEKITVPSWVPQWNHVFRATISPWDSEERFSAAKGMPRTFGKPLTSEMLVLEGIEVGVIGHAFGFMWHEADISLLQSTHLKDFFRSEAGLRLLATTLTAGRNAYGSISKNYSATVADLAAYVLSWGHPEPGCNLDWNGSWSGPRKFNPLYRRINQVVSQMDTAFLTDLAIGGDAGRFAETAVRYCECRRLFLTMNGYLGLGSDTLREGDVLCILGGGDMPYVLRPLKQKDSSEIQYLFVGECYVEGLMTGEAIEHLNARTIMTGAIPPNLVLKTVFDAISKTRERSMRFSQREIEEEFNEVQQLLAAAQRQEIEQSIKLEVPQKRYFEIC